MAEKQTLDDIDAQLMEPGAKPMREGTITGLYLYPSVHQGRGKWIMRYISPQTAKRRHMGLGTYPDVSIDGARRQAQAARKCIESGQDPIELRNRADRFSSASSRNQTFEQLARRYHDEISSGFRNSKHSDQWLRALEKHVFPFIGRTKVATLDPRVFSTCLKPIWLAKPATARRIRQRCDAVMKWSMALGYITENPLTNVERLLPKQPTKRARTCHFPALPWKAIPSFISDVLRKHPNATHYVMLELVILTACRSGEIRKMRWEDLDFEEEIFTIPAKRMKTGVAHRVPLTPRVLQLLKCQSSKRTSFSGLVFQSRRETEVCDHALTNILRHSKTPSDVKNRFATTHGFRSSFRDWASESGYAKDLAERTLAHATLSVAEAAYHRTDLLDQRREIMSDWEDFCLSRPIGPRIPSRETDSSPIERLATEAEAYRKAESIRTYVRSVLEAHAENDCAARLLEIDNWASWALRQAEELDPIAKMRLHTGG